MKEKSNVLVVTTLLFIVVALAGCVTTPVRQETQGVVFQQQTEVVQKAAVDALVVTGLDVKKSDPL